MEQSTDLAPMSDRFNAFHLAVAVHQERCRWILQNLDIDDVGVGMLQQLNDDLLALIELQDCN